MLARIVCFCLVLGWLSGSPAGVRPASQAPAPNTYTVFMPEGRRSLPYRSSGGTDLVALDQVASLFSFTTAEDAALNALTITARGQRVNARIVQRPDIQGLMARVRVEPVEEEHPARPGSAPWDQVTVATRDGRRLESARVSDERGSPQLPLSTGELWTKFSGCLAVGNAGLPARPLFDALTSLERQSGVHALAPRS